MKRGKRLTALLLTAAMAVGGFTMTSYAKLVKISSVSIEIKSEIEIGETPDLDKVEVKARGAKYSVSDVLFTNDSFEWQEDDTPVLQVRLEAADNYYFSVTAKDITIKGGTYVTAMREDSTHLLITIRLASLKEQAGQIEDAGWEGQTVAKWSEAANTGNYEVKLYRDGTNIKLTQITTTNSMDMASGMTKAGTYYYKVRAVNKINAQNKSAWKESDTITVDNELATRMRELYGNQTSGLTEPGQDTGGSAQTAATGWIQDSKGWWYRNTDGSYTKDNWQMVNGKWYYFDSNGYMVTGWIQSNDKWYYCDLADGSMLTGQLTPDGLRVGSDGVWIQP